MTQFILEHPWMAFCLLFMIIRVFDNAVTNFFNGRWERMKAAERAKEKK